MDQCNPVWSSNGNHIVNKLINVFVNICLLRAGPQDLPASSFLMLLTAVLGLMTGTVVLGSAFNNPFEALLAQLMDLIFLVLFLRLGLTYKRIEARFLQSATALFGCGVLINIAIMPVQLMMGGDPAASALGQVGVLFFLLLSVWTLVVIAHVFRHTFETNFLAGSMLAIGYFIFINWLVQLFFTVS